MYLLTVYFNGPRTRWSGRACPDEMLLQEPIRWLWLARLRARGLVSNFIADRVGWAITKDVKTVDEFVPPEMPT